MNPDLKCQLFCLEFLQENGESTARKVAREATACRIPGNVGANMARMAEEGLLIREKRAGRYAYYRIADPIEAEGVIGSLQLMRRAENGKAIQ